MTAIGAAKKRLEKELPPIPDSVPSAKGRVEVRLVKDLESCSGLYDPIERVILVESNLTLVDKWCVVFHEAVHMAISDSDLSATAGLTAEVEEHVAVCIGNYLVTQALSAKPMLRWPVKRRKGDG